MQIIEYSSVGTLKQFRRVITQNPDISSTSILKNICYLKRLFRLVNCTEQDREYYLQSAELIASRGLLIAA